MLRLQGNRQARLMLSACEMGHAEAGGLCSRNIREMERNESMSWRDRLAAIDRALASIREYRSYAVTIACCLLVSLPLCLRAAEIEAAALDESFYVANGAVHDIVVQDTGDGATIYIAGDFTKLGSLTGSGLGLSAEEGAKLEGFPEVTGSVYTVIPDGEAPNGWYIGGAFTHVDGSEQPSIAYIRPDKTLDPSFNPFSELALRGSIDTMVLDDNILYVGGSFFSLADVEFAGLAAIDTDSGEIVTTWSPTPRPGTTITHMVLHESTLYVAGNFETIGGQERAGLAALETLATDSQSTGAANPQWDPSPGTGTVLNLAVSGGYVYAGGTFDSIGGQDRSRIAAVETRQTGDGTGRAHATWDPDVFVDPSIEPDTDCNDETDDEDDGICQIHEFVSRLLLSGNVLYVIGAFDAIGGQERTNIAALDAIGAGDRDWRYEDAR